MPHCLRGNIKAALSTLVHVYSYCFSVIDIFGLNGADMPCNLCSAGLSKPDEILGSAEGVKCATSQFFATSLPTAVSNTTILFIVQKNK